MRGWSLAAGKGYATGGSALLHKGGAKQIFEKEATSLSFHLLYLRSEFVCTDAPRSPDSSHTTHLRPRAG